MHDEVILSTTRLNAIEGLDADTGVVTCGAGVVLETLDAQAPAYLREYGFVAPLDLGAAGTCTIGGNLATNAGGVRFVRYGSLRGACVGLEFVKADGTIVDCARTSLRKDNTGYAFTSIVDRVRGDAGRDHEMLYRVSLVVTFVNVAWLACRDFDEVRKVLTTARSTLGEILSAVEFLDRGALDATLRAHPGIEDPLQTDAPFRVLVETAGCHEAHDSEKLESFLESVPSTSRTAASLQQLQR